ncbi:MAG TPA: geranylgeranyl reductase family protein, partial [Ilumatobacteraceae bacterium]|nr:geranylgeranyl reductase family protein [Ilumatobacteraceae bacterium]
MTQSLTADVVIVGAGPAGSTAATLLARAGRSVVVVDKAVFPRDKCCGDGLTTLALRELEQLGLQPSMVPNWKSVDAAWLRSPSGREVCVPLPDDGIFAATTPRRELDAALVDLAIEAGATVLQGHALTGVHEMPASIVVDVDGDAVGTIEARYLIAADGMWSATRKALGVGETGYLGEWHAFRQYARNVTGPAAERLIVWFEPDLLPGYMWSFPLPGGRANVGFGVQRDGIRRVRDMRQLWDDLLQRPHVVKALGAGFELEDRHTAWPIPAGIDRAVLTKGRVCFVGDAAMATDTMTGEGIGQALLTGRLAAEAIIAGGALAPDAVAARYESTVRHHLLADHKMSARLSKVLSHKLGARGAIRLLSTSDWTRRNFARWMFEDEPRAIALTPSRWHRHLLHQPAP